MNHPVRKVSKDNNAVCVYKSDVNKKKYITRKSQVNVKNIST
jgi:hypothetical protein